MREDQQSVIMLEQPAGENRKWTSDLPSWMILVGTHNLVLNTARFMCF